ncbi:hypothetical protein LR48_Vigan04g041700 [Vigna angularis]|uniref:Uncharacterized protein n=1 Tax=Phaseolus angularis TaxID=3914 RepID=A0A0L9UCG5_PHAAN|nr:hypothetical protein LR48_Vigan04g041700 [Vigna angularis]
MNRHCNGAGKVLNPDEFTNKTNEALKSAHKTAPEPLQSHQQSVVAPEDASQHAPRRPPAHPPSSGRFSDLRLARYGDTEGEIRSKEASRQGRKESGKRHG